MTEANPGVRTTTYNRLVKENGGVAPTPVALRKKLLHTLLENLERTNGKSEQTIVWWGKEEP